MKLCILLISGWLFLTGCLSEKSLQRHGPLTQITHFTVLPFFSAYENFDKEVLFKTLISCLQEIGEVKIINESVSSATPQTPVVFFLSLGGYQEENRGSIKIVSPVEVAINKFKTTCPIWHINFAEQNVAYPVIMNDQVHFKTHRKEKQLTELRNSPEFVLRKLIADFTEEYQQSNSEKQKPVFLVYQAV